MALEVLGTNAPPADLTLLAFEDLVDVGVGTDESEAIEPAIDLSAFSLASFTGMSVASDGLGGTIVTFAGGDSIVVLNLDPAALTPADAII